MTARESFLSFARGAFVTKTPYHYPDKTTPVARADAVYQFLKDDTLLSARGSRMSAVWHLLSWCVVALEEHLSEEHQPRRAPTDEEVKIVAEKIAEMAATTGWGKPWTNLCAGAVIRALDEYRAGKRGEG